ncbi:MAG: ATP-binding cassette domain-containing protein [Gammaproteobacteria bacterium]|nr:ATP-binding cassette domain-containing protein [Gammaproteobacteria bacterium]
MTILTLSNVSLAFGHHPLLAHVDFEIEPGERVCLIGRNGTGKSTLFRVIENLTQPDDGKVWRKDTLRISHLEQEVPQDASHTIYEVVAAGLGELGQILTKYHSTIHQTTDHDAASLEKMSQLQHQIEVHDGWNLDQKIETVLSRLVLPADKRLADCSGGVRRRVMLAQALVSEPDLLLLDEPTNHMDLTAITWLEEFLLSFKGALIFITHDRTFLKHLATRIIELDRGALTSFPYNYDNYLQKKEELLEIESRANAKFDKKLAEEEAWIRKGIKARRTRNEGRVRALESLRKERGSRVGLTGKVRLNVDSSDLSGKLVTDLRHVNFKYGDQWIVKDFSTRIMRGDRIGVIGPNGSGKSTLLKIILDELKPDSGQVVIGTKLQLAYFDQQREILDPEKTVRENIGDGNDYIEVKGRPKHVVGYLRDFLFPPERIDSPVKILSGGERNRLLLARLFTRPANMMILDEPTNDLDVDTLELLENLLTDYEGTLLLVSHDRAFLDNVVTSTLVFEGDGRVGEYIGGYEDWLRQRKDRITSNKQSGKNNSQTETNKNLAENVKKQKLTYKEAKELESLPQIIETHELKIQQLEQQIGENKFYQQEKDTITATLNKLEKLRNELQLAYDRWEHLDSN